MDRFLEAARAIHADLVSTRRHLHQHPELSFQEVNTSAYIVKRLTELGIKHRTGIGGHGILAELGNAENKLIALRGDMDALPIVEENDVPYKSQNPGVMHACGHDVHTTCLLGAVQILQQVESELAGGIRFIFQPAEERLPGGASLMIADGALQKPNVKLIFGQHVFPDMEVGNVGFKPGIYMASADELYITIHGKGGHAALPHSLIDPVLISAQVIVAIQQLVSRRARPDLPTVVSIGKVAAQGATNVIPDKVVLEGTIRALDEAWRAELHNLLLKLVNEMTTSMGGSAEIEIRKGYPCLTNNTEWTVWAKTQAQEMLGDDKVHDLGIRMTAEDFAYYAQEIPACFYRLGTSNKAKNLGAPLHTNKFDIDEDALVIGTALMARLAFEGLRKL